jgi:hypothetical protein
MKQALSSSPVPVTDSVATSMRTTNCPGTSKPTETDRSPLSPTRQTPAASPHLLQEVLA